MLSPSEFHHLGIFPQINSYEPKTTKPYSWWPPTAVGGGGGGRGRTTTSGCQSVPGAVDARLPTEPCFKGIPPVFPQPPDFWAPFPSQLLTCLQILNVELSGVGLNLSPRTWVSKKYYFISFQLINWGPASSQDAGNFHLCHY